MGTTAHGNATHDLTYGIITDSFRRNPSPRAAETVMGTSAARARSWFKDPRACCRPSPSPNGPRRLKDLQGGFEVPLDTLGLHLLTAHSTSRDATMYRTCTHTRRSRK